MGSWVGRVDRNLFYEIVSTYPSRIKILSKSGGISADLPQVQQTLILPIAISNHQPDGKSALYVENTESKIFFLAYSTLPVRSWSIEFKPGHSLFVFMSGKSKKTTRILISLKKIKPIVRVFLKLVSASTLPYKYSAIIQIQTKLVNSYIYLQMFIFLH